MHTTNINTIMRVFDLSELNLSSVMYDKDNESQIRVYMTAIDHLYHTGNIFKSHGFNMYSEFDAICGYTTLYRY